MSIGGYASPQQYDEMIQALQKFNQTILTSAENMSRCGQVCTAAMGSDDLSTNAVAQLEAGVRAYRNVTSKSVDLQRKLSADREAVLRLIRLASSQGGE